MKIKKLFENRILAGFGILFIFSVIMGLVLAGDVIINAPAGEINATTINAPTGRTATYVVCANDSVNKAQCDYVCDGVDDQVEIQAANDALPSSGGTIVISSGHYSTSYRIVPKDNTTWLGYGAIIQGTNSSEDIFRWDLAGSENVKIMGFTLIGGKSGIKLGSSNNALIRDCTIKNPAYSGIYSYGSRNITIENNHIIEVGEIGIQLDGGVSDFIVRGNLIKGDPVDTLYGIRTYPASNGVIENNIVRSTKYNGISIYRDSNYVSVSGNIVHNTGHSAIAISPAQYIIISNNVVYGITSADEAGIEVEWKSTHGGNNASHDVVVSSNLVKDCNWGILVRNVDAGPISHDVIINNNDVSNCSIGIYLKNGTDISVKGNRLSNNSQNIQNTAVDVSIMYNDGYTTENSGNVSKKNGDTISHGLDCTPTYISVTPSNADHIASVTAKSSSTFTLGLKDYNGTAITTPEEIYWYAEC